MRPPISYYGGKQRMASKIVPLIPKHTVYVEPFCGGATILFAKPWPNVSSIAHYREIINDYDKNIITFFKILRDRGDELCEKISLTLYSEEEYKISKNFDCEDDLEKARRYFVNIQQSFSNNLNGGWGRNVFSRNNAATWQNKINHLNDYIERMQNIYISCDDALKVIKQWDSPQTFFYCDPPYPGANQGHYKGYNIQDFKNLIDTLDYCQGSFLLSNYEQKDVLIPPHWEKFEFDAVASSRGRVNYDRSKKMDESDQNRKRKEIVWRRFNRVPVREEIQALYDSGKFNCFV